MFENTLFTTKLNRQKIGEILFYIGITLELLFVLYDKSAFHSLNTGMWFRVTFLLFAIKVILTKYTIKEWCWFAFFGLIGFISYKCSSRNDMLRLVVMCAAFKDVDYKKVMKYAFYVMTAGCLLILFLAFTGIFGEMSMTAAFRLRQVETRYTFGFGHPNQMHCMFFAVATLGVFCFWEKVNWIWLCGLMISNCLLFVFTDSRGGLIGMTCTCIITLVLKYLKKVRDMKWPYLVVIACLIFVGLLSVGMAYFGLHYYQADYPRIWDSDVFREFYELDDKLLSGRLWSCYGMTTTDMRNFGLFAKPGNNEFMDMGFYRLFYWYGYIPGIIFLAVNILLILFSYKNKDYRIFMMVACFSAYTFLEAHFISPYLGRNYLFFVFGGVGSGILHASEGKSVGWWELIHFLKEHRAS